MKKTVYFVASMDMQRVKIGKTIDLANWLGDLGRMSPYPLLLVGEIDGGLYVEAALHERFITDALHGEWFRASRQLDDLISEIQTVGRGWSTIHLPLHSRADGIDCDGSGLRGTGRYHAQVTLRRLGFCMTKKRRAPWQLNANSPAAANSEVDAEKAKNPRSYRGF